MNEQKSEKMKTPEVTEYQIGSTTYIVTTHFNPQSDETLEDILRRLIARQSEIDHPSA